jgi:DNA polymerase-3 subunit alpha
MGKKKPEEMAKQREIFLAGTDKNGIDQRLAGNIFDLMEKFAGYGFNKSHSAAYALLAYQTAWLKVNYPAAFMAAVLSADMQNTDKIVILKDECRAMGLVLLAPDINRSEFQFLASEKNQIVYGLGAIKGLGEAFVENIVVTRQQDGTFSDIFDLCSRINDKRVNRRTLEALILAGALDSIGPNDDPDYSRAVMLAALDEAIKLADQQARNSDSGMSDLFGETVAASAPEIGYASFNKVHRFSLGTRLKGEQDTLGLYFSAHPVDQYSQELTQLVNNRINDLTSTDRNQTVAGLVVGVRSIKTRRGDVMGILTLDDRSARIDITVYAEQFIENRDKINKGAVLIVEGPVSEDDFTGGLKMRAEKVSTLLEARQASVKCLLVDWACVDQGETGLDNLSEILRLYNNGSCPMKIRYSCNGAEGNIVLSDEWSVTPDDELIHRLRDTYGEDSLRLEY